MNWLDTLRNVTVGAGVGVALVTALPVFGAIGTVTAAGTVVGSVVGAAAGAADSLRDD